jgi:hypothetical protein
MLQPKISAENSVADQECLPLRNIKCLGSGILDQGSGLKHVLIKCNVKKTPTMPAKALLSNQIGCFS